MEIQEKRAEEETSQSAKLLYRPVGMISGIASGMIAGKVFHLLWKRATPGDGADAPKALESEYSFGQVVLAAALQGAVFASVKAAVDRGGARAFQRWTGEWPGS